MNLKTASSLFFAVTIIAIGLIGLAGANVAPIGPPVPKTLPGRELLANLCNLVLLLCGAGLLMKRTAAPAALALFAWLVIWTVAFKVPFIVRAPLEEVSYQTNGMNAVLIAAAWVLYGGFAEGSNFLASDRGQRIAYLLYGLALIAFGLSHFFYLEMTAPLVPSWLPGPVFWAYLTGCAYLVAGIFLITVIGARLGAMIAAVQITLITVLVWGTMILGGPMSSRHLQETIVSWALTAGAWVLASGWRREKAA